jgi:hypothetical protein
VFNFCIACQQRHIENREDEVVVFDKDGMGLVVYAKECEGVAKEMTVDKLISRGYTKPGVAESIIEGIREGYTDSKKQKKRSKI